MGKKRKKYRGIADGTPASIENINDQKRVMLDLKCRLLATSVYEWTNLPNGYESSFIEKILYQRRICGIAYSGMINHFMVGEVTGAGGLNYKGRFTEWNLQTPNNAYSETFNDEDIVIIRNNIDEIPTSLICEPYIKTMYEIERSRDTNIIQQKTPKIIKCAEEQKRTIEIMFEQVNENKPLILTGKELGFDNADILDITSPFVADKLRIEESATWLDLISVLGINNANTDKKERLIQDEVNANNQMLEYATMGFLDCRQKAAKEFNEKFYKYYGLVDSWTGELEVNKRGGSLLNEPMDNGIKKYNS